jgi:glycosyltransferase involved in cell wall biosynthesis
MAAAEDPAEPAGRPHAAILSPDPANPAGGVERMCLLLSGVLRREGWTTTVVGPGRDPGRAVFRLGAGHLYRSLLATRAARALAPDLIVSNGFLGMGPDMGRVPRIHVYHGTMVGDTRAEGSTLSRRERARRAIGGGTAEALAGQGATVVSVSAAAAAEVHRLYRVRTDAVIPNGIDTSVFTPRPRAEARRMMGLSDDVRYCLFAGRMQHRKGSDLVLAACRDTGYELLIAGEHGQEGARSLGVLAPEALATAYSACDCVLFPSRYEACSYVVLEALACGATLVTTRVGWVPTLLQGVPEYDALCVRPEHGDIVRVLDRLGEIPTAELAARAQTWVVENNSLQSYAQHWRELLAGLDLPPARIRSRSDAGHAKRG